MLRFLHISKAAKQRKMNKEQKQEVIEALKEKFTQYSNFYITNTESLSVAQITNLRRHCFNKQVEMKVAKNTLIKKALESLDNDKYSGVYDSLHQVTALMFSESPKEPALIISSFRKTLNAEKPLLKAAFLNGDIFVGDNQLVNLTKIKTKNELIGEVIGLLMAPIQRVIGALQNRPETSTDAETAKAETSSVKEAATTSVTTEAPKVDATETTTATKVPKAEVPKAETPKAEAPKVEVAVAPKAETAEVPKAEVPKAEVLKVEVAEAHKAETEIPKAEIPKAETPKVETPKVDAHKPKGSSESNTETEAK